MRAKPELDTIEARIQASAPVLPPERREEVLRLCRQQRQRKPYFAWYGRLCLAGAFTGLVLFCWVASGYLDTQSRAMIAGTNGRPGSSLAMRANLSAHMEADGVKFGIALRWRMRQLALLLHEKHSG